MRTYHLCMYRYSPKTCIYTHTHDDRQEAVYNGYYKGFGFKFQVVVAPDGLIVDVAGPYAGRMHDSSMVTASRLEARLEQFMVIHGKDFTIYGDPAYRAARFVRKPRQRIGASAADKLYNRTMSRARVAVEHVIGHVTQQFAALDYTRTQRLEDRQVSKQYLVAIFLLNVRTCLRGGNQISKFFDCDPPTLAEFLHDRDPNDPLPPRLEELGLFPAAYGEEED